MFFSGLIQFHFSFNSIVRTAEVTGHRLQ